MNFSDRIKLFKSGASMMIGSAVGQWEGWERNRLRARPVTRLESQDSALDFGTREQLMAEARSLCQVFPVAKRILKKFTAYTVGDLRYKWSTGNPEHNAQYRDYWYSWMDRADANGRHRFTKLASMAMTGMLRDGDVFASFVPAGPTGADIQVRLIEGDRIGNYSNGNVNIDNEAQRITGGIISDVMGRPVAYRLNKRGSYGNFKFEQDIPAVQVRHLYDPDRVDAVRGVTAFHPVLNHLRDMKETIDAEKAAIKQHSKIALLVKSVMGGARSGFGGMTLNENLDSTAADSSNVNVQEVNDAMTAYMVPSEDMKAFQSNRPDKGLMDFQNLMLELIAIGFSLPVSVVMKMSGTGPAVRHDMSDAQRTFDMAMDTLEEKFLEPIVGQVIANGMARGLLPQNPEWFKFERQRPAAITIDMGKESAANINENGAWLRSGTDIYAESGKDHNEEIQRIAAERAMRYKAAEVAAKQYGVPVEYILAEQKNEQPTIEEEDDDAPAKKP